MATRHRTSGSTVFQNATSGIRLFQSRKIIVSNSPLVQRAEYRQVDTWQDVGAIMVSDVQTMDDTTGSRSTFNACTHSKRFPFPAEKLCLGALLPAEYPPLINLPYNWTTYGKQVLGLRPLSGLWTNTTPADFSSGIFPEVDWADLVYKVGYGLDGRMRAGQNMIVSLAEIAETVAMVKHAANLRKIVGGLRKTLTLRQLMKSSAGRYLEWQFGWKNLYRDVAAIAAVWSEVRHRLDYLRESVNTFTRISERKTYNVTNLPTSKISSYFQSAYRAVDFSIAYARRTACFSLDVRRTEQQIVWSKFDQIVSRLGGRELKTALWDLVPFSFVVDWFTHVNRTLEQRSIDWPTYDLRRIGYSTKDSYYITGRDSSSVSVGSRTNAVSYDVGPVCVQTKYTRTTGFPVATSSVGLFGNLSKTQIAEGVALIVQRL